MTNPKIVVVIPTVRPNQYSRFLSAWNNLFNKHAVTLVTVWDGGIPKVDIHCYSNDRSESIEYSQTLYSTHKSLIYRYTDACRNLGFIIAAHLKPDYVLTLDDDVEPWSEQNLPINADIVRDIRSTCDDPIQAHLDVLQKRVPLGWMNTAHDTELYLRGVPYNIRNEAPVMLSHGVWVGTPDFDGETQLQFESLHDEYKPVPLPYSLPYYVGPIPKGVLAPICGMNVMIRVEALPYFYFAPMGKDTGIVEECEICKMNSYVYADGGKLPNCPRCGTPHETTHGVVKKKPLLNRFADIWMGINLKRKFDELGWACYTGGSTILHTRASDAKKNFEQEKLGREWNENVENYLENYESLCGGHDSPMCNYFRTYHQKREQFADLITGIFLNK